MVGAKAVAKAAGLDRTSAERWVVLLAAAMVADWVENEAALKVAETVDSTVDEMDCQMVGMRVGSMGGLKVGS